MTECVPGCGRCCDPVVTSFDPATKTDGPSTAFVREHWHVIRSKDTDAGPRWESRCDRFDPKTRLCTAHDERPPICSGFPWYGGQRGLMPMDPGCSFNADVPGLLLPLFVVNEQVTKQGSACGHPPADTYSGNADYDARDHS